MNYIRIAVAAADETQRELLIALLGEYGAEGFEETEQELYAFIPEADFREEELQEVLQTQGLTYTKSAVAQQNWNQQWEENFQPVQIGDFCRIRAHFHQPDSSVQHEIVITPKMSFGTGHHATTRLMVEQMAMLDFKGKQVLDFGTGTGVLAILAAQLGAATITAIDNDEWSYENAIENTNGNGCGQIQVQLGVLDDISDAARFDVILANINRHILLATMDRMATLLQQDGTLLMSGLLEADADIVCMAAQTAGFSTRVIIGNAGWIGILCHKI